MECSGARTAPARRAPPHRSGLPPRSPATSLGRHPTEFRQGDPRECDPIHGRLNAGNSMQWWWARARQACSARALRANRGCACCSSITRHALLRRYESPAGGRCNFTNREAGPANFLSENPAFCRSALARYTPQDFIKLVQRHGIAFHEKHKGQLFCDDSAEQIIQMLVKECEVGRRDSLAAVHGGRCAATCPMAASSWTPARGR